MSHAELIISASAQSHLDAHPDVRSLIAEAWSLADPPDAHVALPLQIDLGRIVGLSGAVATPLITVDTPALFALRTGRRRPSRVVSDDIEDAQRATSLVSLIVRPLAGGYSLISAWIGGLAPREPWDARSAEERAESLAWWCSHALVHDSATMAAPVESCWSSVLL